MCVCLCLGSLFDVLEETGGPKADVTECLGKKRLHSGKPELTFRRSEDTSSTVFIACLLLDMRRGENASQSRRLGERLGKIVATEAPPAPSLKGEYQRGTSHLGSESCWVEGAVW